MCSPSLSKRPERPWRQRGGTGEGSVQTLKGLKDDNGENPWKLPVQAHGQTRMVTSSLQ